MDSAVHPFAQRGIDHLVLVDPRFPQKLARDDSRLKVVLRPGEIDDLDLRSWEGRHELSFDTVGVGHLEVAQALP